MPEPLHGVVELVTFHDPDSCHAVLKVLARGHRERVTVVGKTPKVVVGEYLEASGDWSHHRVHGPQFVAVEMRLVPPSTETGIAKYLASGLVKGIGPTYAKKIVAAFGDKTLEVIDHSPGYLSQVPGIGPKRIEQIRRSWQEQKHVREIMVFLQSHGVGTARAARIYKEYGEQAVEMVRSNPYRLSTDIWGIGFKTADELALKLNIPRDSPLRARAAVRHVLQEASTEGHVGLPEELVTEQTASLMGSGPELVTAAIEDLRLTEEVVRDTPFLAAGLNRPPPEYADSSALLYLKPMFLAELGVARSIQALLSGTHPLPATDVPAAVAWAESRLGIALAPAQREAVGLALTEKVLVLTGGPGTGKTTIVRAILDIFEAKKQRVVLCAPTGRAAKRLGEATGREAKTVHRTLEYDASQRGFLRGKENPLEAELVVIDEVSMADIGLANQLLRAIPPWAAVVLVGDGDQLPSVGPGSVLADLINSGIVPVARLTQVHRQAGESWIVRAAHAINSGHEPESAPAGGEGDFYFVESPDAESTVRKVVEMVANRIPKRFGLDPIAGVQVLAPMNKGLVGVRNLNEELQRALNQPSEAKAEALRFGVTFRVGDKVIQTRNNYQREVFNGDLGRIIAIDVNEQILSVEFDGRAADYDYSDLDELQLAYCTSIHKSQGSEYPAVVIPLETAHWVMLRRNLVYTGVTRGKKLVAVVGSRKALGIAVRTADSARRFTLLAWRLSQAAAAGAAS